MITHKKTLKRAILFLTYAISSAAALGQEGKVCLAAYDHKSTDHQHVAVLRPIVTVRDSGGTAEAASEEIARGLHGVLARSFTDKDYTLMLDPMFMEEWEETPPNDRHVKALNDNLSRVFTDPTLEYSAGPGCHTILDTSFDVTRIAGLQEIDALVLARAYGFLPITKRKDGIARIPDMLEGLTAGGTSLPDLHFRIVILGARTGELVYYCEAHATGNYVESPDSRLSSPVHRCLERYFDAGRRKR